MQEEADELFDVDGSHVPPELARDRRKRNRGG